MPKTASDISVGLAPMYGVTDFPTRLWFYLISGCEVMTSPFLRVTDSYPHKVPYEWAPEIFDEAIKKSLAFTTIPQLMASSPKRFVETYELLKTYSAEVEINCGCPSPKVVGHGAGSSLLRDVKLFKDFIHYVSSNIPDELFSVKIRTGYDNADRFDDLLEAINHLPLKKLTIHGRTKEEKYSGLARWDLIAKASKICSFPVYASGDIRNQESFCKALEAMPGIQGLIVGRGALRRPWIFHELKSGQEINCKPEAIIPSLLCFGYIMEMYRSHFEDLRKLILNGHFSKAFLLDQSPWEELRLKLQSYVPEISKVTLGRMKMMLGYLLQNSFPALDGTKVLRSRSFADFERELIALFKL